MMIGLTLSHHTFALIINEHDETLLAKPVFILFLAVIFKLWYVFIKEKSEGLTCSTLIFCSFSSEIATFFLWKRFNKASLFVQIICAKCSQKYCSTWLLVLKHSSMAFKTACEYYLGDHIAIYFYVVVCNRIKTTK